MFLLHINDLLSVVNSAIRLFADDCLIYRPIRSREDQDILQGDLDSVERWSDIFGMKFNPSKCNIMSIARSRSPFTYYVAHYVWPYHETVRMSVCPSVCLSVCLSRVISRKRSQIEP